MKRGSTRRFGIIVAAAMLIVAVWLGTMNAVSSQRAEAIAHEQADTSNLALAFEGQLQAELGLLTQTLHTVSTAWQEDPTHFRFDLREPGSPGSVAGSLHLFIANAHGIIVQSTRPELVGVDVSKRDYFQHDRDLPPGSAEQSSTFIGPSTYGLITKRLQMNLARRLETPDGRFAGVVGLSFDTQALIGIYSEANLGAHGFAALIGLADGQIRALGGATAESGTQRQPILDSPLYRAVRDVPLGNWIGPSAIDGILRIHGFRHVSGHDLVVVIGTDVDEALRTTAAWNNGAYMFAFGVSTLIVLLSIMLFREFGAAQTRERGLGQDRAVLARANLALESARQRADRKALELQATLAGMSDGVSVLDPELRLVQWNDNFIEFTGIPRELVHPGVPFEVLLRAQAQAGEFGAVDIDAEVARRIGALRLRSYAGIKERIRPDGRTIELRRTLLPTGGFVTLVSDISPRKQAEALLHRARADAEAATEAKSRFVATVSHEIRAPLNTVLNTLTLLSETMMSSAQRRLVSMARQSGDALLNLISDILEMSKMEAGRLVVRPAAFTVAPIVDGVMEMFRATASSRGLAISSRLAPGVPDVIQSDPGRLRQVLINLVSNASKFAAPGTIEIVTETMIESGRTLLRFSVTDPGPALSEASRGRLFQPFSRLEDSTALGKPGTGLGLAISQRIAVLLGGVMGCEPSEAGGNRFWFALPLEQVVARASSPAEPPRLRPVMPRARILLVDDVEANQIVTATMLRREGHHIAVAGSGEAALEMLTRLPFDMVLMDIYMPGMSGFEATRHLRLLPGPAGALPVVALTANVTDEDRARCREVGMQDMLSKPVELARLLGSIAFHVWPERRPRALAPAHPPAGVPPAKRPDTIDGERLAELRANLSPAILAKLIEQCLDDIEARLPRLSAALEGGSIALIEAEAHALAGIAGGYGMGALDDGLRRIMSAAARGEVEAARRQGLEMPGLFQRARDALGAELAMQAA